MVLTSFGFNGRFWPMRRPLFRGGVCGEGMGLSLIMVVSGEPTPSNLSARSPSTG
jgi:hypothetical protein